jgi:hypothetical protein
MARFSNARWEISTYQADSPAALEAVPAAGLDADLALSSRGDARLPE